VAERAVLVTGASTGIGHACARRLDRRGWRVFAGVRKQDDADRLESESSGNLHAVILDVADEASIQAAAKVVIEATEGRLDGLVNNAGITVQGPLEYLPLDDLRMQLEVNVTGQLAVTQALLPSIRTARGRIVFMSSIAGRVPALPLLGPYAASKKALEALAEALRLELLPWRIPVSLVEPGAIATPIWEKGDATFEELIESLPEEGRKRYEKTLQRGRRVAMGAGRRGLSPDKVAAVVERALTSRRPRPRYLVGPDAKARALFEPVLPTAARDRAVARVLGYDREGGLGG
jgi:NAD(P)-dependent dehydrogenase (short-subunit alcohol dehydrogenase family)